MKQYRLLTYITGIFTATLILGNVLDNKLIQLFGLALPAGIIVFPLAYLAGDVLTEVYGYSTSRSVIWTGLFALILAAVTIEIARRLPAASFWQNQAAFDATLGRIPRIIVASITAYFAGEFVNSYVVARVKVLMNGRQMWIRFVASTIAGQFVDTAVFVAIAFIGVLPNSELVPVTLGAWAVKVGWEIIALPFTLVVVRWIKRVEQEDYYDVNTRFNPFVLRGSVARLSA